MNVNSRGGWGGGVGKIEKPEITRIKKVKNNHFLRSRSKY